MKRSQAAAKIGGFQPSKAEDGASINAQSPTCQGREGLSAAARLVGFTAEGVLVQQLFGGLYLPRRDGEAGGFGEAGQGTARLVAVGARRSFNHGCTSKEEQPLAGCQVRRVFGFSARDLDMMVIHSYSSLN